MIVQRPIQVGFLACLIVLAMAHPALAQTTGSTSLETAGQAILSLMTGPTAKIFSTIAVVGVGVGCLLGRLDLHLAFRVVLGIGIIFGGAQIAQMIIGS